MVYVHSDDGIPFYEIEEPHVEQERTRVPLLLAKAWEEWQEYGGEG